MRLNKIIVESKCLWTFFMLTLQDILLTTIHHHKQTNNPNNTNYNNNKTITDIKNNLP